MASAMTLSCQIGNSGSISASNTRPWPLGGCGIASRAVRAHFKKVIDNPVFLLGIVAFLTALLLQSGELGSIDTTRRLQTTHSFWTSAPPVVPEDYPDFGIVGRNGRIYAWYGMGQCLLMLPADMIGTYLERLPVFANFADHDPGIRTIVVSYSTNILVCVLTVLVCFRFLLLLEFTPNQCIAGAFTLLFGTTFLHYTQNMMENNFLLLLTLTGLWLQYEWLLTGSTRALLTGSLALGANVLTRLTTVLDIAAAGLFILVIPSVENVRGRGLLARLWEYIRVVAPCYALFVLIDRLYQYRRFGTLWNTYLSVFAEQQRKLDPDLPPNFPWTTPLHTGALGPLITREKSLFLYDPLMLLTILLAILIWKRFRPEIQAYLTSGFCLLGAYILFYARYYDWSGDSAWGDRFITTPVQLLAMLSIPLLLRHRESLRKLACQLGIALAAVSVIVQIASIVFWHPLEIQQMDTLGHPTFVVGLRFKNIGAVALGKVGQWGLSNQLTREAGIHSATPYFLPFLLKKDGSVSGATADSLVAVWFALLAALMSILLLIRRKAQRGDFSALRPLRAGALDGMRMRRSHTIE